MMEEGASIGGEGSSGGLVQGDFNYCRDSMVAAVTIAGALKKRGTRIFGSVRSYSQVRVKLTMERKRVLAAIKELQKQHPGADTLDGLKLDLSGHSWVLIRASGTEDIVRVSAEAPSTEEAQQLANSFLDQLKRFGA
jgi:phosphomannomutase